MSDKKGKPDPTLLMLGVILLMVLSACSGRPSNQGEPTSGFIQVDTPNPEQEQETVKPTLSPIPTVIPQVPEPTDTSAPTPEPQVQTLPMPLIAAESHRMNPTILEKIQNLGLNTVRHNALLWSDIEPEKGARNWDAVKDLETKLANASKMGLNVILIVSSTPTWAQKVPGSYCGPVKEEEFSAFAQFMSDVVSRYSQPPYNVKYWELGNEPDIDPSLVPGNSIYGCWGDQNDEYYGGGYYAEMLKVVYPAIKAADPGALVLIGGLLLDCDPTNPPEGKDCRQANFLEGILKNDGGDYFDYVSFHGYPPYNGTLSLDVHYPDWEHRGGVVLGKVDFLREVMARYSVDKPLIHTEGSLICPEWNSKDCNPPDEAFFEAQADYAVILFVRNWAEGLAGTIWYQFEGPGWRYGGLLDKNQNPSKAYDSLQYLISELGNTGFYRQLDTYPGVRAYEFVGAGKRVWVLWSDSGDPVTISVPDNLIEMYDKYGNSVESPGAEVAISSPVYMEITP